MKVSYWIDPVVRVAERGARHEPDKQALVAVDVRKRRAISTPLFAFGGSNVRYLLITNSSDYRAVARRDRLTVAFDLFAERARLSLDIDYLLRCLPGHEQDLAVALCAEGHPQEILDSRVAQWTAELLRGREAQLLENFPSLAAELAAHLAASARAVGAELQAEVRPSTSGALKPVELRDLKVSVRLPDSDQEIELILHHLELAIDEPRRMLAHLRHSQLTELRTAVLEEVKSFFRGVSLDRVATELSGSVAAELRTHLAPLLQRHGRTVGLLSLSSSVKQVEFEHQVIPCKFTCRIVEYPEPVGIEASVRFKLRNLGLYRRAGEPPLKEWIERQVRRVCEEVLSLLTYSELCTAEGDKKREIETKMIALGEAIGVEIAQVTTITNLQFDQLRRTFELPPIDEEFATKHAHLRVGMEIHVSTRIPDPTPIRDRLNRRVDVTGEMHREALGAAKRVMYGVEAEEFFMWFESRPDEKEPLQDRLVREIAAVLRPFGAREIRVWCRRRGNEITKHMEGLLKSRREFTLELQGDFLPIVFDGTLAVTGVDGSGWFPFVNHLPSMDTLEAELKRYLQSSLLRFDGADLEGADSFTMRPRIEELAAGYMKEQFGLLVTVPTWNRRPTGTEQVRVQQAAARLAHVHQQFQQELEAHTAATTARILGASTDVVNLLKERDKLQMQRIELVSSGDPEDVREVNHRIAQIDKALGEAQAALKGSEINDAMAHTKAALGARPAKKERLLPAASPEGKERDR